MSRKSMRSLMIRLIGVNAAARRRRERDAQRTTVSYGSVQSQRR